MVAAGGTKALRYVAGTFAMEHQHDQAFVDAIFIANRMDGVNRDF